MKVSSQVLEVKIESRKSYHSRKRCTRNEYLYCTTNRYPDPIGTTSTMKITWTIGRIKMPKARACLGLSCWDVPKFPWEAEGKNVFGSDMLAVSYFGFAERSTELMPRGTGFGERLIIDFFYFFLNNPVAQEI